jgi:predicted RND superfamily exporter protein
MRLPLLLLCLALTSVFLFQARNAKLYDDPNEWLPASNPVGQLNKFLQEKFGGGNLVTIQVTVQDGDIFNPDTLAKVKRMTREVLLTWGVIPYNVLSVAALQVRYLKATDEFLDNTPLMDEVPTTPEAMERFRYGVTTNPLVQGVLVSPDFKSTIIIADFRTGSGFRADLPTTDPVAIYQRIKAITATERDAKHVIQAAGTPITIGWVNSDGLPYIALAFVLFIAGVTAVLWFAFRSFRGAFIAISLGLIASVWAFGLKFLFYGYVLRSASALIAPFIVLAAAACHHTQFLKRFFDEEYPATGDARLAIVNTFTPLLFPMTAALATDIAAFVIMSFVPFENVSELGATTAFGLGAIIFNVFFLQIPMLAFLHGSPAEAEAVKQRTQEKRKSALVRFLEARVDDLVERNSRGWVMVGAVLVLFIGSLLYLPRLDIGQDNSYAIHNFLTKSWEGNEIYQMEQNIKARFRGVYPLNIYIESTEEEGLKNPEALKKIEAFAQYMETFPQVAGTMGLPVYIKLMSQFMRGGNPADFRLPDDRAEVGYYMEMYAQDVPGSFDAVVDYTFQKSFFSVYTSDTSHATVNTIMRAAEEYARTKFNEATLTATVGGGAVAIAEGFNRDIAKWLIYATTAATLLSFMVLVPMSGSLVGPVLLLTPLVMGSVMWLVLMQLTGIEINSNTTTGMAIASGVGVDAELYLLGRFREEYRKHGNFRLALKRGFISVREALTFSYLGLIAGCWVLIPIPLYVGYMGYGMGMILLVCFVCSFIISPFLWSLLQPKFLIRGLEPGVEQDKAISSAAL